VARNSTTLTIPAFNPMSFLNVPSGATHFRLINALSVVSDFIFNPATGAYEPADAVLNELSKIAYSSYLPVDAVTPLTTIVAGLTGLPTLSTDVSVLASIGIEFYQQVGANYYLFNAGNAMKVQEVF